MVPTCACACVMCGGRSARVLDVVRRKHGFCVADAVDSLLNPDSSSFGTSVLQNTQVPAIPRWKAATEQRRSGMLAHGNWDSVQICSLETLAVQTLVLQFGGAFLLQAFLSSSRWAF